MMAFQSLLGVLFVVAFVTDSWCKDYLKDFDFNDGRDSDEVMIAQESRHYQTFVKPPVRIVKPTGVVNSHRPQYNLDSFEDGLGDFEDFLATTTRRTVAYKPAYKLRSKESMIKDAVLRALERKDHVGKFAQILPIIRAMSGSQRVALASLVASQVTTPPGRAPLNLAQVRSMFGNNANTTTDLMLPILLDTANLIRRAVRPGKQSREVKQPPPAQMLRRSFTEVESYIDDDIHTEETNITNDSTTADKTIEHNNDTTPNTGDRMNEHNIITTVNPVTQRIRNRRIILPRGLHRQSLNAHGHNKSVMNDTKHAENVTATIPNIKDDDKNISRTSTEASIISRGRSVLKRADNSSVDLTADASNQTLAQDLPVAEKLRALHRYVDRKGNLIRRGNYPLKPITRRPTAEPTLNPIPRRRPAPPRKLPTPTSPTTDQSKCELFTNSLCLQTDDYPTEAIVQSIRRNKAAASALLADFRDPGEGAVDGVTASQEAKYTAEHYLLSNRRGDTANRDFAGAGEAGFMCPSTVKYARPQRARATSGQWKYIVNTGEHTQTLRLEKCLKPKESCTYLTDNFKSKCVQVYNYHRLLTWDQQNGLHMDIFKVPTCCSCHIEGYSVSFPPLGHRIHETSSEQFPGDDLVPEHGNQAFESVQSTVNRPSVSKTPPFTSKKPIEPFPPFTDSHNLLNGLSYNKAKLNENDEVSNGHFSHPMDSYGNTYFPDSFDQASTVRKTKRPVQSSKIAATSSNFDSVTLPSYLEPPTPAGPNSFTFIKETPNKYKITGSQFKRGPVRPNRRPIHKKISSGPEDLISSGTSAVESYADSDFETLDDFNDELEDVEIGPNVDTEIGTNVHVGLPKRVTIVPKLHAVTTEPASTTFTLPSQSNFLNENLPINHKRVNYNYHPIIDFFGEDEKERENQSIDREDTETGYIANVQSEWKPINNPPSRNEHSTNLVGKKETLA